MPYKPYLFYIETLDNPGWSLHVPMMAIEDTDYIREYPSDDIWFFQGIRQNEFSCAGDETKLVRIFLETLKYFDIPLTPELEELIPLIEFVQMWYANECDEYWEHLYGVSMKVNKEHHCHIVIDLDETY